MKIPPLPPEGVKKLEYVPLTLPSPTKGEGKHFEIKKNFPPPGWGRGRVGVIYGIISHLQGGWGDLNGTGDEGKERQVCYG